MGASVGYDGGRSKNRAANGRKIIRSQWGYMEEGEPGKERVVSRRTHEASKMMGEARSLQWAANQHANRLNAKEVSPSSDPIAVLGHLLSSLILQALAAETGLKALQQRELGDFDATHDLFKLFTRLGPVTQDNINEKYQEAVQSMDFSASVVARGEFVGDVLERHRHDFIDWRYIYELPDGSHVNLVDLRLATVALILVF